MKGRRNMVSIIATAAISIFSMFLLTANAFTEQNVFSRPAITTNPTSAGKTSTTPIFEVSSTTAGPRDDDLAFHVDIAGDVVTKGPTNAPITIIYYNHDNAGSVPSLEDIIYHNLDNAGSGLPSLEDDSFETTSATGTAGPANNKNNNNRMPGGWFWLLTGLVGGTVSFLSCFYCLQQRCRCYFDATDTQYYRTKKDDVVGGSSVGESSTMVSSLGNATNSAREKDNVENPLAMETAAVFDNRSVDRNNKGYDFAAIAAGSNDVAVIDANLDIVDLDDCDDVEHEDETVRTSNNEYPPSRDFVGTATQNGPTSGSKQPSGEGEHSFTEANRRREGIGEDNCLQQEEEGFATIAADTKDINLDYYDEEYVEETVHEDEEFELFTILEDQEVGSGWHGSYGSI